MSTLEWILVALVVLVLLTAGSWVAVWWWRLVAKMAPYEDEVARSTQRRHERDNDPVVVITEPDADQAQPPAAQAAARKGKEHGDLRP